MHTKLKFACLAAAVTMLAQPALAEEKMTIFYPSVMQPNQEKFLQEWSGKVRADSKNAVSFDIKSNSPLANFGNVIDRVEHDVIQVGWALTSIFPRKFDLTNVVSLPFIVDLEDKDQAGAALWRLYKTGMLDSEFQTVIPMFIAPSKQSGFHFAKAPKSLDHLEGLKIRIYSNLQVDMVKSLGMSPVSMPPNDIYMAVKRGTIDGTITSWTTFPAANLQEVTTYHVELPLGGAALMYFMARKKYNFLPAAIRSAFDKNSNEAYSRAYGILLGEDAERGKKTSSGPGQTIVRLTPEKTAEWRQKFGNAWIANWEKATAPNGAKVLAEFKKIYADVLAGK
jgi:TRAP-type transport system periplasmic protein